MIVFTLSAAAKESGYFSDGTSVITIAVITKSQLILDGVSTPFVRFVAIAVGCLFAHNSEDMADGVDIHISFLLLEIVIQLAEEWIELLSESHRRPNGQDYKCITSVHDDMLFSCS